MSKLDFKSFSNWFFKDKRGNWAIAQFPNMLFVLWIGLVFITAVLSDIHIKSSLRLLQDSLLFTWAYLELTEGISRFRRTLGAAILVVILAGFFGQ